MTPLFLYLFIDILLYMKIAYFSRNRNFAGPLLEELSQHHTVKLWQYNVNDLVNTISIRNLLDWCDIGFLEWLQPPTIEISQLQGIDKPLIAFCQGIDVYNHGAVDWRNISGLIIQDANYDRLLMLRKQWEQRHKGQRLTPLPETLIQSIGVDLREFEFIEQVEPEYRILIHASQIRDTKRIYEAIQQFYDLLQKDPEKPWEFHLIGHWESGYKDAERREYLQALRELIRILDFPPKRFYMTPRDLSREDWAGFAKTIDIYWCTSWRESFGASMAECAASGAYPLINYYLGADEIYPKEHLCKTPSEMVEKTIAWGNLSTEEKLEERKKIRKHIEQYDCRKAAENMRLFIEKKSGLN